MFAAALLLAFASPVFARQGGAHVRPVECNVLPGERGANVWERAKIPELRRYCDLLASASAKLAPGSHMIRDAVRLASEADALVPGRAAPLLLQGRALSQLDELPQALTALRTAESRDDHAFDDPLVLLAWARSLAFAGETAAARAAYRDLLPRADALPLADRGVAYLGAGMLAMAAGPESLGETVAILRQARRDSQDLLRTAATFALALALDRSGDGGEAAAVLAEGGAGEAGTVMTDRRVLRAMGKAGEEEVQPIVGLALDAAGKHDAARAMWQAYVTAGRGVWQAHAKAHAGAKAGAKAGAHP